MNHIQEDSKSKIYRRKKAIQKKTSLQIGFVSKLFRRHSGLKNVILVRCAPMLIVGISMLGFWWSIWTTSLLLSQKQQLSSSPVSEQVQQQKRLCTVEETRHGLWVPVTLDKPPYIPTKSKCYTTEELQNATSWPYYHWHPFGNANGECRFDQWDADLFCTLAYNKTVGFMGDSLTWEQFASLAGLLGIQVGAHNELRFTLKDGQSYNQEIPMSLRVCNGNTKLGFYRNKYILYPRYFLKEINPDVMVFNRGAHIASNEDLVHGYGNKKGESGMLSLIEDLHEYQEKSCRRQGRDCLSIWRTTSPGHPQCSNFTKPESNVTKMKEWISDDETLHRYGWWNFQKTDQMILNMFRNASTSLFNFDVLRAYDINILRPDAHVGSDDCLHNCDPGAADVYNTMLLHLMQLHYSSSEKLN